MRVRSTSCDDSNCTVCSGPRWISSCLRCQNGEPGQRCGRAAGGQGRAWYPGHRSRDRNAPDLRNRTRCNGPGSVCRSLAAGPHTRAYADHTDSTNRESVDCSAVLRNGARTGRSVPGNCGNASRCNAGCRRHDSRPARKRRTAIGDVSPHQFPTLIRQPAISSRSQRLRRDSLQERTYTNT